MRGGSAQRVVLHEPGHELGRFRLFHGTRCAAPCARAADIGYFSTENKLTMHFTMVTTNDLSKVSHIKQFQRKVVLMLSTKEIA